MKQFLERLQTVAFALLLVPSLFAQSSAPDLRGTWSASIGPKQIVRGTWSATLLETNTAQGSFTVVNERSQVVVRGTWAAAKSDGAWRGSWSARVVQDRRPERTFSGTWQADAIPLKSGTLTDMLQLTLSKTIGGSWRSGGRAGNWWLYGPT